MKPRSIFEIHDLDTLQLVNDPFRMRILTLLAQEPLAVRSLADRLEVPVTRLYYHVNLLEQRGLIEVVERRKVGAMTQRLYRAVAEGYRASAALVESIEDDQLSAAVVVATVVEGARADAESALGRRLDDGQQHQVAMGRYFIQLTPERFEHWSNELRKLVETMANEETDESTDLYTFTMVLAPAATASKQNHR